MQEIKLLENESTLFLPIWQKTQTNCSSYWLTAAFDQITIGTKLEMWVFVSKNEE